MNSSLSYPWLQAISFKTRLVSVLILVSIFHAAMFGLLFLHGMPHRPLQGGDFTHGNGTGGESIYGQQPVSAIPFQSSLASKNFSCSHVHVEVQGVQCQGRPAVAQLVLLATARGIPSLSFCLSLFLSLSPFATCAVHRFRPSY